MHNRKRKHGLNAPSVISIHDAALELALGYEEEADGEIVEGCCPNVEWGLKRLHEAIASGELEEYDLKLNDMEKAIHLKVIEGSELDAYLHMSDSEKAEYQKATGCDDLGVYLRLRDAGYEYDSDQIKGIWLDDLVAWCEQQNHPSRLEIRKMFRPEVPRWRIWIGKGREWWTLEEAAYLICGAEPGSEHPPRYKDVLAALRGRFSAVQAGGMGKSPALADTETLEYKDPASLGAKREQLVCFAQGELGIEVPAPLKTLLEPLASALVKQANSMDCATMPTPSKRTGPRITLDPPPRKWADVLIWADDERRDGVHVKVAGGKRQGVFFTAIELGFTSKNGRETAVWPVLLDALDSPQVGADSLLHASIAYAPSEKPATKRKWVSQINHILKEAFGIDSHPFKSTVRKKNLYEGTWLSVFITHEKPT